MHTHVSFKLRETENAHITTDEARLIEISNAFHKRTTSRENKFV